MSDDDSVVDTNVWAVAAGMHAGATDGQRALCVEWLTSFRTAGTLYVDMDHAILTEYYGVLPRNSLARRQLSAMQAEGRVTPRQIDWESDGGQRVARVPGCLSGLHRSDRKFAAVALAEPPAVPVVVAWDSDWAKCAEGVAQAGLTVRELLHGTE